MHDLKIEKGIPIPPLPEPEAPKKSHLQEVLETMNDGDSILIGQYSPVVMALAQSLGISVITRNVDGGTRLWRVENPGLAISTAEL